VTHSYDKRQQSNDYAKQYILRRFNQRAWKGEIGDVDSEAPQLMVDEMPRPTHVAKTGLASAGIEWEVVCPVCGVEEENATFDFHHWDYDQDHGCRMCRDCHNAIHGGRRAREQAATTGRELDVGPRGIFYCEKGEMEPGDELVEGAELRLDDTPPNSDHTLLEMIRWGYLYKRESDWWGEWLELC